MTAFRPQLSLAAKVLLRLLLNLVVVGAALAGVLLFQVRINPGWLLAGSAGERLRSVAEMLSTDLALAGAGNEASLVTQYEQAYGLEFRLFEPNGRELTGRTNLVPREVRDEIVRTRVPQPGRERAGVRRLQMPTTDRVGPEPPAEDAPPDDLTRPGNRRQGQGGVRRDPLGLGPPAGGGAGGRGAAFRLHARDAAMPRAVVHAGVPAAYWIVVPLPPQNAGPGLILVLRAPWPWSGGILVDPQPWLLAGAGTVALSVIFWLPFARHITRDVGRMTRQTEDIAAGRFDTRLGLDRSDELGRLSSAIDRMAARLANHVAGQKRFLGDAAHELSSPIARMQAAVAILESRTSPEHAGYLNDLREELDEMAALIQELLAFSRASHGRSVRSERVDVRPLIERAWSREGRSDACFENTVPDGLAVQADALLLQRAVANLLRNAVRHAGTAGPIVVSARRDGDHVLVHVSDSGPGVPAEALPRLFEPFFRPEDSRTRELGGAGLGLAIVKTCLDACQGTVAARNREPAGFEVTLRLPAAPPSPA